MTSLETTWLEPLGGGVTSDARTPFCPCGVAWRHRTAAWVANTPCLRGARCVRGVFWYLPVVWKPPRVESLGHNGGRSTHSDAAGDAGVLLRRAMDDRQVLPEPAPRHLASCPAPLLTAAAPTHSMAVILFNKWLLAYSGFPFPLALTMCVPEDAGRPATRLPLPTRPQPGAAPPGASRAARSHVKFPAGLEPLSQGAPVTLTATPPLPQLAHGVLQHGGLPARARLQGGQGGEHAAA
jgi:hypothetical protein